MTRSSTLAPTRRATAEPIREHDVRGGGGVRLHVHEWGVADGPPILFLHGWSQCDLCWGAQVAGPLAERFRLVTFDHRGHGRSEKPVEAGAYTDGRLWADDVAAVLGATGLRRPTLVAWSYGGLVATDYVRAYGDRDIAALDLVGASVMLRPPAFDNVGPGFLENAPDACGPDLGTNIAAVRRFLEACTARPLPEELERAALAWNMAVPPEVRGALLARELDATDVLSSLSVPVLVTHGRQDTIILPSMAEHVLATCPTATASWYDRVGHLPFAEDTERFDRELAALVVGG
jgi:non-heme chloroperoxidase